MNFPFVDIDGSSMMRTAVAIVRLSIKKVKSELKERADVSERIEGR